MVARCRDKTQQAKVVKVVGVVVTPMVYVRLRYQQNKQYQQGSKGVAITPIPGRKGCVVYCSRGDSKTQHLEATPLISRVVDRALCARARGAMHAGLAIIRTPTKSMLQVVVIGRTPTESMSTQQASQLQNADAPVFVEM